MSNVILLLTLYKEARKAPNSLLRIRGLLPCWGAVEKCLVLTAARASRKLKGENV